LIKFSAAATLDIFSSRFIASLEIRRAIGAASRGSFESFVTYLCAAIVSAAAENSEAGVRRHPLDAAAEGLSWQQWEETQFDETNCAGGI